jgi:hypothetical protein
MTGARGGDAAATTDAAPPAARRLLAILFAALLIPGVVGFDLWPLTGWRLFSLALDDTAERWVIEAVDEEGSSRLVSPEELPFGYRHAEWPMRSLPDTSPERREAMCVALAAAVAEVDPTVVELRIAEDQQRLVETDGEWSVEHDHDVLHACSPPQRHQASDRMEPPA